MERLDGQQRVSSTDTLAVEEPLRISLAEQPPVFIMRTPGNDLELVRGLLFSEEVVFDERFANITLTEAPPSRQQVAEVTVATTGKKRLIWPKRGLPALSSCGVCGTSEEPSLSIHKPVMSNAEFSFEVVASVPRTMRTHQEQFQQTGGLHAAALFDETGTMLVLREDIGRHNAVDKVIGWALGNDAISFDKCLLGVTSRLSFEIAQKAVRAQIPVVCAISAPSSLAVDVGERFRLTLCGFARHGRFNIYSHSARIRSLC